MLINPQNIKIETKTETKNLKTETKNLKTEKLPELCLAYIFKYCSRDVISIFYGCSTYYENFILNFYKNYFDRIDNFPIYRNQWKAALQVYHNFKRGLNYVLLTAQPQSGKTGACQALVHLIKSNPNELGIKNVYFICGMNDNNLKQF